MNALVGNNNLLPSTAIQTGFHIGPHDRLTIAGKAFRLVGNSGANVILRPATEDGLAEQFSMETLGRLSAAGKIRHEAGFYLPEFRKMASNAGAVEISLAGLPAVKRERLRVKHALVQAVEELIAEGVIRNNDADIKAQKSEIAERARLFLQDQADVRDMCRHGAAQHGQPVREEKGNKLTLTIKPPNASTLRKMVAKFRKFGIAGLADELSRSGNHSSYFRPEEQVLLMTTVRESYLTLERKTIRATVTDVARAFTAENAHRAEQGLTPLRTPKRDAVRAYINKLEKLTVKIAREGRDEAIKSLRPVNKGLEVARPLQRVEMDEWEIDLQSIIYSTNLHTVLGEEFLKAVGLDQTVARWWLVAAIDCRTRMIVGMKLTRNPKASSAVECLRMVLSDKGEWADAVGALTPWFHAGPPETLVTDNGPGFKASIFTNCCNDLRIALLRSIAGVPAMRGTIERVLQTAGVSLMERLVGRTFSNVVERGSYPSEDRACLDADDLAFTLVRWVVDIYHNMPHAGLGGRTPLAQWEADIHDGNYPLLAMPDTRSKRLAFGKRMTRSLSKAGVTVMGVRYQSRTLASQFLRAGSRPVDIRWDAENLGAIEVFINDEWHEVPAVHDRFDGVQLHVWMKARRALRSRSASRKLWDEETVFRAIDEIEALVDRKSVAFGVIDTSLSDDQLKDFERSLFSGFDIGGAQTTSPAGDGFGRVIAPLAPDPEQPPRKPADKTPAAADHTAPADASAAGEVGRPRQAAMRRKASKKSAAAEVAAPRASKWTIPDHEEEN